MMVPKIEKSIKVKDLLKAKKKHLNLKVVCGTQHLNKKITTASLNRPGLSLSGLLETFRAESIQILGRGENAFCKKEKKAVLEENLGKLLCNPAVPCVIITSKLKPCETLKKVCRKCKVALLRTDMDTAVFSNELTGFLEGELAPVTYEHGVLVQVSGIGVLIRGDAGIGKSECALELIKRGHIFIADDIIEVQRRRSRILTGTSPAILKQYMEVRGLGIIDVELLFGVGAIMDKTRIEMEVNLRHPEKVHCERLGLDKQYVNILGIDIPSLSLPVTPGRNLAVLIEVAALNEQLKQQGIYPAKNFNKKLNKKIQKNHKKTNEKK
ncbi:MAG: HPr(Ser) kinase/phosphatase [Elusimicrobiaceae bacterium]|jgi:HPr kinase/phosphorylase|nr:HPr(Ser) kinase/phosphatase [Elusimicrobiaceae bacterium]MBT3955160.1 HPr(Ser) kinase/phosphatase [Elusimicrobiaceae bacterium]MBT4008687.1 HPr(Ser) kinase/phosphatase [Elusimicrobiaceae bacterium]MBT4402485.1 HPr(Ser) kinase/phosphatase [Elusimicrobiaceae bacterium]MBT4440151.1 HPr(Ser) kinase/phosphatase [Elusimicrobiaceae bacterium]